MKQKRHIPSLNALRAFEAAARHLSFKAAAEELSVSQSAISHQIKALEESLGFPLFTRKTRSVELTRKGRLGSDKLNPRSDENQGQLLTPLPSSIQRTHSP